MRTLVADKTIESLLGKILDEILSIRRRSQKWMSVAEVSDYLGLSTNTVYQYVHKNRIPYKKIPGSSKLIFSRREIDAWLENDSDECHKINEAKTEANRILQEIAEKRV